MRLTYTDLETGWEMVRQNGELREIRDGEVTNVYPVAPIESITLFGHEIDKQSGQTYYVLTINDDYPNDVVECETFCITP
ncbi:hypothetical protein ACOACQ_19005 [Nocardioides sp. CPCC 206347]|uniref:hypothetical protein n=1 Tax=unclassified Nocardioides TaxID=2615069 RepID=UPI0036067678